jgi:N-acyl-L-homoserine lactone synthetase
VTSERDGGLLEVGDAVAADLLDALAPLRFEEVRDDTERRAGYRLRYAAVVERDLAVSEQFLDGEERDEFDDRAVHIVGWHGDDAIATCRLVLPARGVRLPVEVAFELEVPGSEEMVDWGRVVIDPAWRGRDHGVFMGLAARGWLSMRARGYTAALAATPDRLVQLFRDLGFSVTVLGDPREYWNELRYPILCDGEAATPGLARNWGGAATAHSLRDRDTR